MVSTLSYAYDRFAEDPSAEYEQSFHWLLSPRFQSADLRHVQDTNTPKAASIHKITPAITNQNVHQRNLVAASSALALSVVGLDATPLRLAALPILVYMGVPAARQLYRGLQEEGALLAAAETTALAFLLAHGAILPGALAFSLYHLGRIWLARRHDKASGKGENLFIPQNIRVRRAEGDMTIDIEHVLPHEQIVYGSGDLIAFNGTVIEGVAWIQNLTESCALTENVAKVVKTNEAVATGSLILAGSLIVECG